MINLSPFSSPSIKDKQMNFNLDATKILYNIDTLLYPSPNARLLIKGNVSLTLRMRTLVAVMEVSIKSGLVSRPDFMGLGLVSVSSVKCLGLVSVSRFKGLGLARDYSIETTRPEEDKK